MRLLSGRPVAVPSARSAALLSAAAVDTAATAGAPPIRLLLGRECGGQVWRLADACGACAATTAQAAVVSNTVLAGPPGLASAAGSPSPAAHGAR